MKEIFASSGKQRDRHLVNSQIHPELFSSRDERDLPSYLSVKRESRFHFPIKCDFMAVSYVIA